MEDDVSIHKAIEELLIKNNYKVYNAYSGTEALLLLEKEECDVILLDLRLPGLTGEEIIKKINNIPIIVLSAKITSEDKVNCLLNGAADYITKPFDNRELLARIEVQLRRNIKNNNIKSLKYKELELLEDKHTLLIGNNKLSLTKTEYAILKQFLLNVNIILPKSKLLELVNLDTLDGDENSLKVHISNINKKIKRYTKEKYIQAVWGIGYKIGEEENFN